MEQNQVIISLGSNIRPVINMGLAVEHLRHYFRIISVSSFVSTKPIGITDQADFLNGVIMIQTTNAIEEVNILLKKIEDVMGRDRTAPKFGPRIIDLDVLIWNGQVVDEDFYTRDFLQNLVAEIRDEETKLGLQ